MTNKGYDVIVVGAGIGGCGVAALLAKDHGKKVLVLEKAPHIGGRVASYVGKGDKVTIDGLELDSRGFRKSLADSRCWVSHCEPDLDTMFNKGLLDGYTFENGGHGLFWGNKSRVRLLLDHIGKPVDMPVNTGLGYVDAEQNFEIHQVEPRKPYPWQSEDGFKATLSALKQMGSLSMEECAAAMNIDVQTWLEERGLTENEEAYTYLKVVMACQNAMAEPKMAPAGDFLGYMAMARDIKMNLHTGSVATMAEPGCMAIPLAMEEALNEAGGEIWRSTPVEEVIIEDEKVRGVMVRNKEGQYETFEAPIVICNIPPKHIFHVLHPRHFPAEWVDMLQNEFWSPGLLSALIGIKENVWEQYGVDERSFIWMPGIIQEDYIGAVDMVMWNMASCAKRAPEGKRDFIFSTALTDKEMRNPKKVMRVIDFCMDWFRRTFKDWKENVEYVLWTPSDEAYGNWRPVGEKRPDIRSPYVEGLYFVGDQYGERLWGGGVDGASLCAVMCVDTIMTTDLETELYPPYHRGIPKGATP
jgi:phytoene dehydrogenase-like protein